MVKHIVETDVSYWLYIPAGSHRGWREVSRTQVAWAKSTPPDELLAMVAAHEADQKKKAQEGATTGAETQKGTDDATAA
jgi:hypothetical protein